MTYRPAHRQVKLAASWSELIHTQRATKDLRAELKDALTQVLSDQSEYVPGSLLSAHLANVLAAVCLRQASTPASGIRANPVSEVCVL